MRRSDCSSVHGVHSAYISFLVEVYGFSAPEIGNWANREVALTYYRRPLRVQIIYEETGGFGGYAEDLAPGPGIGHIEFTRFLSGHMSRAELFDLWDKPDGWKRVIDILAQELRRWAKEHAAEARDRALRIAFRRDAPNRYDGIMPNAQQFNQLLTSAKRSDRLEAKRLAREFGAGFSTECGESLVKALKHSDPAIREDSIAIVDSVSYSADDAFIKKLFETLLQLVEQDPSPQVRAQALESLCQFRFTDKSLPIFEAHEPRILGLLKSALEASDWYLRSIAADNLWPFAAGGDSTLVDLVKKVATQDADPQVRLGAVHSLQQLRHLTGIPELLNSIAASDSDEAVSGEASNW